MEKATVMVTVNGDIDTVSAHRVGTQLAAAATCCVGVRCLVVDLRAVTFLDSAGLHMLVCARKDLAQRGMDLFLVVRDGTIAARLFQITSLHDVLGVHHRVGDALEAAGRCIQTGTPAVSA
jgi:anti-anti-sigma factor